MRESEKSYYGVETEEELRDAVRDPQIQGERVKGRRRMDIGKRFEHLQPHAKSGYFRHMVRHNCQYKVLGGRHVLVVGATGSGKTYWMSKVCELLPSYIFVNPQEEDIVDTITQVVTEDANEVIQLLEEGYRKIQFLPSEDDLVAIEQLEIIRKDLWEVAAEMNIKDGQWWINFICDEAQIYAPLGSRTNLQSFARRGRRYGVKSWFLSQQPQDLAKGIVNNVEYQVLFRLGQYSSIYFKNYKIPIAEHLEWIKRDYHYVIYDGDRLTRCTPI